MVRHIASDHIVDQSDIKCLRQPGHVGNPMNVFGLEGEHEVGSWLMIGEQL